MINIDNNYEIMTLSEVAQYLKVAEKTVLRMINKGEIPCTKVASQWRFIRSMIDDWLLSRMQVVPRNDLARILVSDKELVPVSRIVKEERSVFPLKPGTKKEIILQLITPLKEQNLIKNTDLFLENLLNREKLMSTGIGQGIALPHLRKPEENLIPGPEIIIGICPEGTDYHSIDNQPVHLFFLIITDSEVVHLRIMSKLTSLLRLTDLPSKLIKVKNRSNITKILIESEIQYSQYIQKRSRI